MNTDGFGKQVTSTNSNDVDPGWSPDGTKIAFAREVGPQDHDIWLMNADGSGAHPLTSGPSDDRYPAFSHDGSKIAYRSEVGSPATFRISTMNADGSNQAAIKGAGGDQPAWSPDGTQIVFTHTTSRTDPVTGAVTTDDDLYTIKVDGSSAATPLTADPSVPDRYAAWDPNTNTILFRRVVSNGRELYQISPAGGTPQALPSPMNPGRAASWSPDATNLVFVSYRDPVVHPDQEIWVGSFSGAFQPRQLTNNDATDDEPRWANVPTAALPVPPSTGGTSGATTVTGAAVGGSTVTVGGGAINGKKALALTLTVAKKQRLRGKKHDRIFAYARCNARCALTASAVGKRAHVRKRLKLFRARRVASANRRVRLSLRLPRKTLRAVRSALKRHRRVTVTITVTASSADGQFTPAASRKTIIRR
jgi:dipeptidyl aminopeptidase/acylaminoacyl peptidase